jgi:YD repeat-containing protein
VRKILSTLLVAFSLLLGGHVAQAQGGTTQYIYEVNGRLSAVIAPSGAAAIYRYDAAGNLTGIDQISAGDLSILSFSPSLGTIGDQVVLVGTGLDTVGTVSFNGTPSQIISASASSLTTTLPAGASTGPITVSGRAERLSVPLLSPWSQEWMYRPQSLPFCRGKLCSFRPWWLEHQTRRSRGW